MLYIEDFTMRHYVGFSQIGSHISACGVDKKQSKIAGKSASYEFCSG